MNDFNVVEILSVIGAVLVVGVLAATLLAATATKRREARHRKISKRRRTGNTEYDLLSGSDAGKEEGRSARRGRSKRRRRGGSHKMIDILQEGSNAGADAQEQQAPVVRSQTE